MCADEIDGFAVEEVKKNKQSNEAKIHPHVPTCYSIDPW